MGIEEDRKAEERRRKKLILLAGDNQLWKDVRSLEVHAGFSLAELRDAALPKKDAKPTSTSSKQATKQQLKPRLPQDVPLKELSAIVSSLSPRTSTREDLLGVSPETLRKMSQGLLKAGHRANQALDVLRNTMLLALRYFHGMGSNADPASSEPGPSDSQTAASETLNRVASLLERISGLRDDLERGLDDSDRVYDVGHKFLGLGIKETQEMVDTALFATKPLLIKPYFQSYDEAYKAFREIGGFYYAWLGRFTGEQKIWMRCCVHVRYVLGLSGGFVIRAKLNVPIFNPSTADFFDSANSVSGKKVPAHEYDGFCDVQGSRLYWVWEKRSKSREDYSYWITTHANKEGYRFPDRAIAPFTGCSGKYLTCHQDMAQSIVSGPIILEPDTADSLIKTDYEKMARIKMWQDPLTCEQDHPEFRRVNALAASLGLEHVSPT
jgi:hypothetical protein